LRLQEILIGHNPLLDLCFLHEAFLHPLPSDVSAFRRNTHTSFPKIVDTKYLSSRLGFCWRTGTGKNPKRNRDRDPSLEELYLSLVNNSQDPSLPGITITPEPGFDPRVSGAAHNAGFDSWMTAVVFVHLSQGIMSMNPGGLGNGVRRQEEPHGRGKGKGLGTAEAEGLVLAGSSSRDDLFRELGPFANRGVRVGSAGVMAHREKGVSLPWETEAVWRRYGNKLRLGRGGVMDLPQE
jgi:poly(A)-specific ribonuclease